MLFCALHPVAMFTDIELLTNLVVKYHSSVNSCQRYPAYILILQTRKDRGTVLE